MHKSVYFLKMYFWKGNSLTSERSSVKQNFVIILIDFSLTVKAATLIIIYGCGLAILSAKEWKSGFIYNLVKS